MMKVVTFFNAKGGTGKTTFTVLMASWLAYKKNCRVAVYDCDYPSYQLLNMRAGDMSFVKTNPLSPAAKFSIGNTFYPVAKAMGKDVFTDAQLSMISSQIRKIKDSGDGYLLLDFPGRFLPSDPAWRLVRDGVVDFVVLPVDTDQQSRGDAMDVYFKMQKIRRGGQRGAFLWNREAPAERRGRRDWYGESTALFREFGIPVIHTRMRDIIIARRDASTFGFIRNTLCWPQANIDKACPYIEDIFEEIKARVDGTFKEREQRIVEQAGASGKN